MNAESDDYGIDAERGHPRALELMPDGFFWSCVDELAPFGSDEGDTALAEFRDWRASNPGAPVEACIVWTIESVGQMEVSEYGDALLDEALLRSQMNDTEFDHQQFVYTLDTSVIATGFAQFADEGSIDTSAKPYIARALRRQIAWAGLSEDWEHAEEYVRNLRRLEEVLAQA